MNVSGPPPAQPPASTTPGLGAIGRAFSKRADGDHDLSTAAAFASTQVRNGFVRKVFAIVALMLAITTGVTFAVLSSPEARLVLMRNQWVSWVFFGAAMILILVLACVPGVTRKHPLNLFLLFAFTCAMSGVVAVASTAYGSNAAGIAFLVTAAAVIGLTLFACQTKYDITHWGGMLFVTLIVLIVLSLIGIFVRSPIYQLVISGIAAVLFSVYIVYDVQLIFVKFVCVVRRGTAGGGICTHKKKAGESGESGPIFRDAPPPCSHAKRPLPQPFKPRQGGRQGAFSVDDYVPAALSLYLDIIVSFFSLGGRCLRGRVCHRRRHRLTRARPSSSCPPPPAPTQRPKTRTHTNRTSSWRSCGSSASRSACDLSFPSFLLPYSGRGRGEKPHQRARLSPAAAPFTSSSSALPPLPRARAYTSRVE
jgi:protein lifeguard